MDEKTKIEWHFRLLSYVALILALIIIYHMAFKGFEEAELVYIILSALLLTVSYGFWVLGWLTEYIKVESDKDEI